MGISVADNFDHKSKKPLDARTSYSTLALMKAVTDANMNEGCLAYCAETDKYYKFLSTNSVDASTGKWREFSSGGGGTTDYSDLTNKPSINNVTLSGNKSSSDLGLAPAGVASNCYSTGDTDEGTLPEGARIPFYHSSTGKKKIPFENIRSILQTYFNGYYSTTKSRETPTSGGSTLSLVNTGDMYTWNNKQATITAGTGLSKSSNTLGIKEFTSSDMADIVTPLPSSASKYMNYSTEEQVVGQWINGATIYQKTINFGTLPNATTKNVAHNISNIGNIIDIKGWLIASGTWYMLPFLSTVSTSRNATASASTTYVSITTGADYSSVTTCYITIQYTKTT